jgi:hypothetical protein
MRIDIETAAATILDKRERRRRSKGRTISRRTARRQKSAARFILLAFY